MPNVLSNAVSGLSLNRLKVNVAAQNIANASTRGYTPQEVIASQLGTNAVGSTQPRTPPTIRTIDEDGQEISLPNVSLDEELIQTSIAETGYRANAAIIRTDRALQKRLLDVLA